MERCLSVRRLMLVINRDLFFNQFFNLVKLSGAGALIGVVSILITLGSYSAEVASGANVYLVEGTISKFYGAAFFFGVCGMISGINRSMSFKGETIGWLTLPATVFEKYLSKLIIAFIAIPVYLFVVFGISEIVRVLFYNIFYSGYTTWFMNPLDVMSNIFHGISDSSGMFFLFVSFFFFCSFIYRKSVLLKTVLTGFVLSVLSIMVVSGTFFVRFKMLLGDKVYDDLHIESLNVSSGNIVLQIFIWLCFLFFIIWPYFRMKDMELIQRF